MKRSISKEIRTRRSQGKAQQRSLNGYRREADVCLTNKERTREQMDKVWGCEEKINR